MEPVRFYPAGDQAVLMVFGSVISEETNQRIRGFMDRVRLKREVVELVPAFCSLLVYYDYRKTTYARMTAFLQKVLAEKKEQRIEKRVIHVLPVCYEEEFGPDMRSVQEHTGLSREEIIQLHTEKEYLIYMLGFLPGFAYLGGLSPRLFCPRLSSPRVKIPAGSVGIGGQQTGIYPLDSPGGWQLIGRTPLEPYQPKAEPPILYEMGEYIRFMPVSKEEFYRIRQEVVGHRYQQEIIEVEAGG